MIIVDIFRALLYLPFLNLLAFFNWAIPGHYAFISIALTTLIVRFILLVPSKRAAEIQRKMNQLQPLLAELKKEYGDDRNGLAMAQMELYKKNNINPLTSSCLPAIIQIVVLIIFYRAIQQGLSTNVSGLYAWLPRATSVNTYLFGINLLANDKYYIFPIIAAALQYLLMRMVNPPVKPTKDGEVDPMVAAQRNMTYILPLLTLYAASRFVAGIAFYWVITTIFSIWQQVQVNKEKLVLTGLKEVVEEVDKEHPTHAPHSKELNALIKEETTSQKGVSVTVRRKK